MAVAIALVAVPIEMVPAKEAAVPLLLNRAEGSEVLR